MRTLHLAESVVLSGMVHEYVPSFVVVAIMAVQAASFIESSILIFPTVPSEFQVIGCTDPVAHFSPPLGDKSVRVGGTIEKIFLLVSKTRAFAASEIRTLQESERVAGIVQV